MPAQKDIHAEADHCQATPDRGSVGEWQVVTPLAPSERKGGVLLTTLPNDPSFAGAKAKLSYVPVVTREPGASELAEHIPQLLADGRLERTAGASLNVTDSRLMICSNPEMARDLRQLVGARGFVTSRRGVLGQMAFEKYW